MEVYQLILAVVLPAVTGIGSAITSIIVCISKVKSVVGSTVKENSMLKKQLAECQEKSNKLQEEIGKQVSETKELIDEKEVEVRNLAKENINLKEAIEIIKQIKDTQETLKNQLTAMLEKGE